MKKQYLMKIWRWSWLALLMVYVLVFACYHILNKVSAGTFFHYSFASDDKNCFLCNDKKESPLAPYRGQQNLGIINLNTFDVIPITINRYDRSGELIKKSVKGVSTHITNMDKSKVILTISEDIDRGFARGHLSVYSDNVLDVKKASSHLCSGCLDRITDGCWSDTPMGIGMINFYSGEVQLFEQDISAFLIGDYYVSCNYQNRDIDDRMGLTLLIFYCPKRY